MIFKHCAVLSFNAQWRLITSWLQPHIQITTSFSSQIRLSIVEMTICNVVIHLNSLVVISVTCDWSCASWFYGFSDDERTKTMTTPAADIMICKPRRHEQWWSESNGDNLLLYKVPHLGKKKKRRKAWHKNECIHWCCNLHANDHGIAVLKCFLYKRIFISGTVMSTHTWSTKIRIFSLERNYP